MIPLWQCNQGGHSAGQDDGRLSDEAVIDLRAVVVPLRDKYHNEYGVRRGAHCFTVELHAVQIYLPVAVAGQARVHEISRVVRAIDTTMVNSPRLYCQGGRRTPRQHPPDPKHPFHCSRVLLK